jgi:phenylalanyl-tRNA synthetase alpha chain
MAKQWSLTQEGQRWLVEGLPEVQLLKLKLPITIKAASKKIPAFSVALQWAKKKGWISIKRDKIFLLKMPKTIPEQQALADIAAGKMPSESLIKLLASRHLIQPKKDIYAKIPQKEEIEQLTPELLKSGLWSKARFKPYNVSLIGKPIWPGRPHILTIWIERIRSIFFDLGFKEVSGPLIESAFWNFDALFVPQDHPARDMADTFYMSNPKKTNLPDPKLVEEVGRTHHTGAATGSIGWGYPWNKAIASQPLLRTHTTAVSARALTAIEPPAKIFCIGRVFRNETIDYKHLPEFTQIEGIVADENVTFRDLLGYLKEFYRRLGFEKIRFRPAYFPYTEMSVEPELYFEEKGEWLELGGAGIFRPEVTIPLGINCPVLAWGLSLERPIMLKLGITDIRSFYYKNDLEWLRKVKLWQP